MTRGDGSKIFVTGVGTICAAGTEPDAVWETVRSGRTALGAVTQWDTTAWPTPLAGEVGNYNARALIPDRKLLKLLRRTDVFGLYAADRAIAAAGLSAYRATLGDAAANEFNDRTGVYVGSGAGAYHNQYDFFPLLTAAGGDLGAFGRELTATINPMWLLRTLPNNVLCHIGIRHDLKGPNACVTSHSVSGTLAIAEAAAALRDGDADRIVAVGHDAPIEPQMMLYMHRLGLLAADAVRPFDPERRGCLLGEGGAAMVLETTAAARARDAVVLGEVLGSACTSEAEGLLAIRADGDGLARAITSALDDAGIAAADVGMIVAHGNGTRNSDVSEAAAIHRVFGADPPPVTAFKWAFGHLLAASGAVEAVLALLALRRGVVPGIATLRTRDSECGNLPVSAAPQAIRTDVALILSRGFAGLSAALLLRA